MKKGILHLFLILVCCSSSTVILCQDDNVIYINSAQELNLIGDKIMYLEDSENILTPKDVVLQKNLLDFKNSQKDIFAQPASNSVFWFKFSVVKSIKEEIWLEVASTYAWYIDFYRQDSAGQLQLISETGTMRPDNSKFFNHNLFWLPLNASEQEKKETYFLRIKASLPFEMPLYIGTVKSLSEKRDINGYLTAGFVGLMVIIFLYSLFLFISTRDNVYIWYLGYLLWMSFSMPYANSYPFIQNLEFLFIDKSFWNNYFLVWHSPVYFFVGMFCINYLNLKKQLPVIYKLIIIELVLLCAIAPLLNLFFLDLVNIISPFQVGVLLLYLTCIITAYYLMFKGQKHARFYVLGWTFMILFVFMFFATVNGFFPFNTFSRNALYFGVALEVWMFSLALGDRINIIRKEKEEAQKKYLNLVDSKNKDLEKNIKERTILLQEALEELETANSELEDKTRKLSESNRNKDVLMSIVGHDLRGPISSFKVLLELALDEKVSKEKLAEVTEKMNLKVDSILFLLENLLQWAKKQKDGIRTMPVSLILKTKIDENLKDVSLKAENKNIKINNFVEDNIKIFCDAVQFNIIIRNLLFNALKFTKKNGQINIKAEFEKDDLVKVAVSDNGIGMDEETRNEIFSEFISNSKHGTDGESGSGIGLSICKEFVRKNGGQISVESEIGKGSTFFFTLPVSNSLKMSE